MLERRAATMVALARDSAPAAPAAPAPEVRASFSSVVILTWVTRCTSAFAWGPIVLRLPIPDLIIEFVGNAADDVLRLVAEVRRLRGLPG